MLTYIPVFLAALTLTGVLAQEPAPRFGSIEGDVKDEKGEPMVGATILFDRTDIASRYTYRARTDRKGHYVHAGLPLGIYNVTLRRDGKEELDFAQGVLLRRDYWGNIRQVINFNLKEIRSSQPAAQTEIQTQPDQGAQRPKEQREKTEVPLEGIKTGVKNPDAVAVVVGIAKYQHADVPEVEFAVNDAQAMKRLLTDTLGYAEPRVLLRSDSELSLSRLRLLVRQDLAARVKPGISDVFVYYSGHGAPNADTREAYLIPWDYDPAYAPTGDSAYPLKEFYGDLAKLKARSVTVVLDACFSGQSDSAKGGRAAAVVKDISPPYIEVPLPELPNGLVISATGPREVATWYREQRHGLLTYYFLRGLHGDAADSQGRISVGELERYLQEKVPQAARELRQRSQTPQVIAMERDRVLAQVPVSALKTGEAQLVAKYASLEITIDVGGELLIDGVSQGVIPPGQSFVQQRIAAGTHQIEVRKEGYRPVSEQVIVLPDQPLRKTYQLAAILPEKPQLVEAYGLIQVTADAGGTLYIDGVKAAELTPFARYTTGRIEAGPHQVRVEKAAYQAAGQQVTVLPNQTATAELKLTPIPSVPTPSREEPAVQPTLGHEAVSYIVTSLVDRSSLGLSRSRALNALASDAAGNLYVADADKHLVLKVTPARQISVVAGTGDPGFNGDERPATSAQLSRPQGLALDSAGNLYIADHGNDRVRKVTPGGVIVTVTQLSYPAGVALDGGGNLYILGTGSRREDRLRKVSPAGTVSSVAGVPQGLFGHIVADTAGNLYLTGAARENRNRVFRMSANGAWGVVAGTDERGGFDGDGQPATSAQLNSPTSVAVDAVGNLYIADRGNNRIRKVTPDGLISTIAGTGERGKIVDGDPATWSPLDDPCSLALDNAGNLYVMPGSLGRFDDPGGIVKLVPRQKPAPAIPVRPAKPPTAKPGTAQRPTPETGQDGLEYAWIPPGSFEMGCVPGDSQCEADEKPRHRVSLSRGYWIGRTLVTVAAYKRFAAATGGRLPAAPSFNAGWKLQDHPIVNVRWEDAKAYCRWAAGRLPTEAEWERAARGGQEGLIYPWGNQITHGNANYAGVEGRDRWRYTSPVESSAANGYGLYDVAGNVYEWVRDWYDEKYYGRSPLQDPPGPSSGTAPALRGGSWLTGGAYLRSSNRGRLVPSDRLDNFGFRCVREVP